jgi:hypothetical protein
MKPMTAGERAPAPDATSPVQTSPAQQTSPTNDGTGRARLDPTASPEVSGEYPYEPSTSVPFGVAFAQSRRRAFLAGCGVGASGAIVLVGAVTLVGWLSGPRPENRVTPAPSVTIAPKTVPASAPPAAASATVGGARAAPDVPRRVKQPSRVVAAPIPVEEVAASHPTAVDREAAVRAGDDEDEDSPASDDGSEPKQSAEAEDGEASGGAQAQAQTTEEQGPALEERPAAATDAPAQAGESSDEPDRVALVPAVEPEQTPASDGAPEAPVNADRAQ